ncbi:MAG: flagellar motor protein MotB [Methylophilus sp.]|uniref:flagellar motor protein MotB n=1 Tax=Methylophilus sp. TaxID=29541 RepID=UPI003F9F7362
MYRRKIHDDDDDSHDRWLISYADFITLLFAFFVVMYATSSINLNKYQALSSSVVTAFQGKPGQTPTMSTDTPASLQNQSAKLKPLPLNYLYQEKKQRDLDKMRAIGQQLANVLSLWIEQKKLSIHQGEFGIDIALQSGLLFKADQSTLSDEGPYVIKLIGEQLKDEYRTVQVEGHIDRHMYSDDANPEARRWETTATQAARVAAILGMRGVSSKRLSAIGLADTKPASSSENNLAQTVNNRIIIRILTAESNAQQAANNTNTTQLEILPKAAEALEAPVNAPQAETPVPAVVSTNP